jgi:Mrp family chromosome partitioning ATPase
LIWLLALSADLALRQYGKNRRRGETAMIWRGPMVMGALQQMPRQVDWGELDIMIVDLPPGNRRSTADDGAAGAARRCRHRLDPAGHRPLGCRRGLNTFQKVDVPVLGVVENMSYFLRRPARSSRMAERERRLAARASAARRPASSSNKRCCARSDSARQTGSARQRAVQRPARAKAADLPGFAARREKQGEKSIRPRRLPV